MSSQPQNNIAQLLQSLMGANNDPSPSSDGDIFIIKNHIYFYAYVSPQSILRLNVEMRKMMIENQQDAIADETNVRPIHIHINSPGGSAHAGFLGYDYIRNVGSQVPVYTHVEGIAASAATILSVAGNRRYITPSSYMLIHEPRTWMGGAASKITEEYENLQKVAKTIEDIYVRHCGFKIEDLKEFLKHDWILTADECIKYNLVDEIGM